MVTIRGTMIAPHARDEVCTLAVLICSEYRMPTTVMPGGGPESPRSASHSLSRDTFCGVAPTSVKFWRILAMSTRRR